MKKIIVFGASGDTGKYFVDYFISNNKEYKIIAVGTRKTEWFEKYGVDYIQVDITEENEFDKLPQDNIYAVVDFAGLMPARMEGYHPAKYIDVNIKGTVNILEYSRKVKADRILYMQSFGDIKDYGEEKLILTTDLPRNFKFNTDHSVYVISKNAAVDIIQTYHEMFNLKSFIFRLPSIYLWSKEDHFYVDGVKRKIGYRILIDNAIQGKTLEIWGDPKRKKDMIYVKDFCQMVYKALFVDKNKGYYNVGTGIGITLEDQIKGISKVFGNNKSEIVYCPEKNNAPQYIMDITPAFIDLDYRPNYDYIKMLEDMKKEMELNRF